MSTLFEDCPNCGRTYDVIDYRYQICSLCGYIPKRVEMCKFNMSKQYDLVSRLWKVTKCKRWRKDRTNRKFFNHEWNHIKTLQYYG